MSTEFIQRGAETIGRFDTDSSGQIHVYNASGTYMGYVNKHGTFDKNGSLVSESQIPGILLEK